MNLDHEKLSQQLIRALRGDRTQKAASEALGFGSNVFYAWESGRRAPEFSRLVRLLELNDPEVHERLANFFRTPSPHLRGARLSTPRGVQRFVEELLGSQVRTHVAEKADIDRTTLTRWLQGKTEPRVPEVLRLVDVCTQRLLPFIECFVDPITLSETTEPWSDLRAQAELAYEYPWSHALLRALELDVYRNTCRHDAKLLADSLELSECDTEHYLKKLTDAGQIRWTGTHYENNRVLTVDTREDPAGDNALKEHWARVTLDRLRGPERHPQAYFSYNLFAISEENFEKVRQLHLEYYDAVRALVEDSEGADKVVVLNAHLVPLEAPLATVSALPQGVAGGRR